MRLSAAKPGARRRNPERSEGPREKDLAEREGFEPPIPVKVCPLSRRIVSTAHAPLRVGTAVSYQLSAKPRFLASLGMTGAGGFHRPVGQLPTPNCQRLTTFSKKLLQQFGAAAGQDSATDVHAMVQMRMVEHLHY